MPRTILHVDMDQFFAAVEIRDNPALRGLPVIIGADPQAGKGRGVVSTASYEARKFGVHSAMPISVAWRLCPQGVFLPGDMEKYASVSEQIFGIFEAMTPLVEGLSLDEAFLDVSESRLLFGDGPQVARKIKDRIRKEAGLDASVGVAANKSVAKIASDLKKPDALVVVAPGDEAAFLRPLPLKRLWGIGPRAEQSLNALGLRSVADLQDYPPEALRAHFGEHGDGLHDLALGRDERPVLAEHEAKSLGRECTFDEDSRDELLLRSTLAGLCEEVARRLRRHGLRAAQLSIKLRWTGFETHTRQQKLDPPTSHGPDLFGAALPLLRRLLGSDRRQVRLVGIQAAKLLRAGEELQEGLFTAGSEKKERLDQALDRINERYGDDALKRANTE
jgi:DNA polymerase-4